MFIAKLSISLEEADECIGWLHKLAVTRQATGATLEALRQEASELVAILPHHEKRPWGAVGALIRTSLMNQSPINNHQCDLQSRNQQSRNSPAISKSSIVNVHFPSLCSAARFR